MSIALDMVFIRSNVVKRSATWSPGDCDDQVQCKLSKLNSTSSVGSTRSGSLGSCSSESLDDVVGSPHSDALAPASQASIQNLEDFEEPPSQGTIHSSEPAISSQESEWYDDLYPTCKHIFKQRRLVDAGFAVENFFEDLNSR